MIQAKSIMTESVITISENATVAAAAALMINKNVKSLLVVKDNIPIAIVTENGLIKGALSPRSSSTKVRNIMDNKFRVISPNTNYFDIVKKLRKEKIKRFPVVENGRLIGLITETDVINATRDFTRFHQIMQEVILAVFGLVTAFFLFFFSPLGQSIFR